MSASPSVAQTRLATRLSLLRDRYFVGRAAELELFRTALHADTTDRQVAVLFVHGPGGVGKSELLRQFRREVESAGDGVGVLATLDGRDVQASPDAFLGALRTQLAIVDDDSPPLDALARLDRPILLVDTYEVLSPLDTWMREWFLPQLPDRSLVVLASRRPPSAGWRADPAWSDSPRPSRCAT